MPTISQLHEEKQHYIEALNNLDFSKRFVNSLWYIKIIAYTLGLGIAFYFKKPILGVLTLLLLIVLQWVLHMYKRAGIKKTILKISLEIEELKRQNIKHS